MNRLQYETSPYLLQHAGNPVDWYPWGDEAFELAKKTDRPVLVSIGYAACHWCHVMERESFEDEAVAALMNDRFVCIKVDREEHPDVDHLYMDALQSVSGQGGWPLNMFVTPDRQPFYGGTYFPPRPAYGRASWTDVLQAVAHSWQTQKAEIIRQSEQLTLHLKNASELSAGDTVVLEKALTDQIAANLLRDADIEYGGFGSAPKFPSTQSVQYLLEHAHFSGDEASRQHALNTLDGMIAGGIYDQAGGGFSRYATDKQWLAPHFEKMLYDNALLISVLCDAYRITGASRYKDVIMATIDFCNRELRDDSGLLYSALDADSEGQEGKYYTWTFSEWQEALPDAHPAVAAYYGIREEGNWEGTNILHINKDAETVKKEWNLSQEDWEQLLSDHRQRLFEARQKRVRPGTDDKMLLSWNALMNRALTDAAIALDSETYMQQASTHMDAMLNCFVRKDKRLLHVYKNGVAKIEGKLEDYACLVQALLQLAGSSGKLSCIDFAEAFIEHALTDFSDAQGCFFYFSAKQQQDIIVRKTEVYDGALPSANALMMQALWDAGNLLERSNWTERSYNMMQAMAATVVRYPQSFSRWAVFLQQYIYGIRQLVIAGDDAAVQSALWQRNYFPSVRGYFTTKAVPIAMLQGKYREGATNFYLCSGMSCGLPEQHIDAVLSLLGK